MTTAAAYLSEPVSYGGELMSRGALLRELERAAASVTADPYRRRALVRVYLAGRERREETSAA